MRLHPAVFELLLLCTGHWWRYAIGGVLIRAKQGSTLCEAVAADQAAAAVLSWYAETPNEQDVHVIVPRRLIEEAGRRFRAVSKRDKKAVVTLECEGSLCHLAVTCDLPGGGSVAYSAERLDGEYPDIDGMPHWTYPQAEREASTIMVKPKYMLALSRIALAINGDERAFQMTACTDGCMQVWLKTSDDVALRAIVMEMSRESYPLPPIGQTETAEERYRQLIDKLQREHQQELARLRSAIASAFPDQIVQRLDAMANEIREFAATAVG